MSRDLTARSLLLNHIQVKAIVDAPYRCLELAPTKIFVSFVSLWSYLQTMNEDVAAVRLEHYRVNVAASTLTVQAFSEGLLSLFGHDPVIRVRDFEGEIEIVAGTFEKASLKVTINARSLIVVSKVSEKDRQEITNTMHKDVLETTKYPQIVFQSNNVSLSALGSNRYRALVIGELTLHGVTQNNVALKGEVTISTEGLRSKGGFSLRQTAFKIRLVSVAGGTLKIKDEVRGLFDIVAVSE